MHLSLQLCLLMIFLIYPVHSDVELHQKFLMTKPTTKLAKIECTFPSECRFYIHWYQKKNGEPFKRVQYVDIDDQSICNEPGFETLKSEKRGNKFVLIIPNLKREHSATYYCACWVDYFNGYYYYSKKVFGSGTRLIVTDTDTGKDQVKKPQVSMYPMSRPQSNGNSVLLCQARGMFPALVRFTWQAEDQHGRKVELTDDEQLEQRDEDQVQITSMLIVEKDKAMNSKFTCSVQHDSSFDDITPRGMFELSHTLYLFSVLYMMLLAKNVVYFCTVSVLLCNRNRASKEMFKSKAKHANKRYTHQPNTRRFHSMFSINSL